MELRYCDQCGDVIRIEGTAPLEATSSFVCDGCKAGKSKSASAPSHKEGFGNSLQGDNLNLFSTKTIFLHKQRNEAAKPAEGRPKSGRLRLVKPGSASAQQTPDAPPARPAGATGARPGVPAAGQRLLFGCLHCRAPLSIRPVEKTSKLTCPHCHNAIYVTAGGQISKSLRLIKAPGPEASDEMPMVGSVRVRETSTVPAEGIAAPAAGGKGSSRLLREAPGSGSSVVRRAQALASQDMQKTDFIAAGKSSGFRSTASAAPPKRGASGVEGKAPARLPASTERLSCDESDLLEEALEVASSLNEPGAAPAAPSSGATSPGPAAATPEGNKSGLTKRVIKALFQP